VRAFTGAPKSSSGAVEVNGPPRILDARVADSHRSQLADSVVSTESVSGLTRALTLGSLRHAGMWIERNVIREWPAVCLEHQSPSRA